ncbi:MAG TPA: hypothetical protein VGL83_06175 [Stellaceae bacterium]|jgi:hypothetical protein
MSKVIEELTVAGERIHLEHADIPLQDVEPDEENPRIRYGLRYLDMGKTLDERIMKIPQVPALLKDIEANGGLRERIIVQKSGKDYISREGNCRLICYRALAKKHPDDERWKAIPAKIMPKDIDPKKVAVLLTDMHVAGKITWTAHEKAGQVYRMHHDLRMPFEDIAVFLRASKTTAKRFYDAYAFMVEKFLTLDDGKYTKDGERKWSFFDELFRSKSLREEMKADLDFADWYCRLVGNGVLSKGVQVRSLPLVLKNPVARKKLQQGVPFEEVEKILEEDNPEHGSDFFRLLAEMRENCTSAAHVKDILRIRTDKKARQKLVETYEALTDFMRLADVEPPSGDQAEKSAA